MVCVECHGYEILVFYHAVVKAPLSCPMLGEVSAFSSDRLSSRRFPVCPLEPTPLQQVQQA